MKTNIKQVFILVTLSLVILSSACTKKLLTQGSNSNSPNSQNTAIDSTGKDTVMLVMKAPGITTELEFENQLRFLIKSAKLPVHKEYYCPCDTTIKLLRGPGVPQIMEQVASGGSSSTGTKIHGNNGGRYDALIWSKNIIFSIIDSVGQLSDSTPKNNNTPSNFFTVVAVLDTGIDTLADLSSSKNRLTFSLYKNDDVPSCFGNIRNANDGWNFVGNNSNWRDDHPQKHGTAVSKFIVNQVYETQGLNNVKILPIKVFDDSGKGNLSNILCAFAYAKQRGAKIINASFGYYAQKPPKGIPDYSGYFLKNYIEQTLTSDSILLVCAAGNDDPDISWDDTRDLDYFNFFPASLASDLPNVIAVTTIKKWEVVPKQNYSKRVVDIGVLEDNEDFSFSDPLSWDHRGFRKIGSSFATPIVTGKICAYYNRLPSHFKSEILNTLREQQHIVFRNDLLATQIKKGLYTVK